MRYPKQLQPNDTIGFVAPSFGCSTEPYFSVFKNAQKKFGELGNELVFGPNCYEGCGVGISNLPQKCAEELVEEYASDQNDALISCGGGELMCEILEHVDFDRLQKADPKWYMGYSDNTNFTYLNATICDTASIYGPCAGTFGMEPWHSSIEDAYSILNVWESQDGIEYFEVTNYDGYEKESLKDAEHPLAPYHITEAYSQKIYVGNQLIDLSEKRENKSTQGKTKAHPGESSVITKFEGRLIGGCLDCLVTLSGTEFDHTKEFVEKYKEDGFVWFLEACELNVFSIRRAMWQLQRTGWFQYVKGFLIGRPLMAEEMIGLNHYDAFLKVAAEYNVPIIFDLDIGHVAPMMPLVVGSYAKAEATADGIKIRMEKR